MELIFDISDPLRLSFGTAPPLSLSFETGQTVVTSDNKAADAYMYTTPVGIEELSDAALIPHGGWSWSQETTDEEKNSSTLTINIGGDCLLVAAMMHRSDDVSLDGDGWTKLVDSASIDPSNRNQHITVFTKRVTAGIHTVTATLQKTARITLKLIAIYETSGLTVVEDRLIPTVPTTPIATTGKRRLYMLHSAYASTGSRPPMAMELDPSNTNKGLLSAEELRFSVFYDWSLDGETPVFVYFDRYNYTTNYAGLLVLDIEEEEQNGN